MDAQANWDKSINELSSIYRNVERELFLLPPFSVMPLLLFFWNYVKFILCLMLDILLLIPLNVLIFIRNIFPGRWRYRSFSWKYIKYVFIWIWRGEAPVIPSIVIRPLVILMLSSHADSRLNLMQKFIYLDDKLQPESRAQLMSAITGLREHWKRPQIISSLYTYVLPISGSIITCYNGLFPNELHFLSGFLGWMLLGYAISFVTSAFMVKRAVMVGDVGHSAYFPGALAGAKYYAREREILAEIGLKAKEFPLDIFLYFISISFGYFSINATLRFYNGIGMQVPTNNHMIIQMIIQGAIFVILMALSLYRRNVTGRI